MNNGEPSVVYYVQTYLIHHKQNKCKYTHQIPLL